MYKLYYYWAGVKKLLYECENLLQVQHVATSFGYLKYEIKSDKRESILVGIRSSFHIDPQFIQWRIINPSKRKGGAKRL